MLSGKLSGLPPSRYCHQSFTCCRLKLHGNISDKSRPKYKDNILLCCFTDLGSSKSAPTVQEQEEEVVAGYGVICGVRRVSSLDADTGSGGRDYIPYYPPFARGTNFALPYTECLHQVGGQGLIIRLKICSLEIGRPQFFFRKRQLSKCRIKSA